MKQVFTRDCTAEEAELLHEYFLQECTTVRIMMELDPEATRLWQALARLN
jgi:hypothetical protein